MKRFFTTIFLLSGVAFSLIISDSYFKQQKAQYSAQNSKEELYKSIDLTKADAFDAKGSKSKMGFRN